jgi:tRNA(Ile)-lysidine synthetase-like protein
MTAPHLAVRRAVTESLGDLPPDEPVLVACSGGADSLALAAALGYVGARDRRPAGAVTVDHGLQQGSATRARDVAAALESLGLDPVEVIHARVDAGTEGPEGRARRTRYAALDAAATRHGASAVLLGHTRDDQAETVLLGLARGSGGRSLAGMAMATGRYRRPLLHLSRETVRAAVPAGLATWEDPHNADPAYARARVRHRVLPTLEAELGPGLGAALARTADLLRADTDALDDWAERALDGCLIIAGSVSHQQHRTGNDQTPGAVGTPVRLDVGRLASYPRAVRWRVLRRAAITAGSPPTDLAAAHVEAVDALLTRWSGQVGVDLPGKLRARRAGAELRIAPPD